jgi:inner membrane transporter RhtA
MDRRSRATSISLVLGSVLSVQIGAAAATTLFVHVGPAGAVLLRTAFAALALVVLWRPSFRGRDPRAMRLAALLGITLAGMNLSFYAGLDRIPLGVAVTFEFIGPLGVAIAGSRRPVDFAWALFAAGGIALFSPGIGSSLDALGVGFALLAGAFWAAYIYLTARVGAAFQGGEGLALAMIIAGALVLPFGIAQAGSDLLDAEALALGLSVAVLSSVIPYSLELEALRRLPTAVFGVLMSLEPAVAALVGFIALGQDLGLNEAAAIACVVVASAGALRGAPAMVES